jgi:hypothetical protein
VREKGFKEIAYTSHQPGALNLGLQPSATSVKGIGNGYLLGANKNPLLFPIGSSGGQI